MTDELYRLTYYSRNRLGASPAELDAMVQQILAASRHNNARVNITGALMFNAGCFAQVLEGPRLAVEQTFERIQQDDRHGDVNVLSFGPTDKRSFDRWSMAFVGASRPHARRYDNVATESGFDPAKMTGDALFQTLERLIVEEEDAA